MHEICLPVDRDIELVQVSPDHSKDLFALVEESRLSLRQWLPWVDMVQTLDDEFKYIDYYRRKFIYEGALNTTIFCRGQAAGFVGFNYIDWGRHQAAVGYWLGDRFRGHGIMRRSVKTLVTHGFEQINLHKVKILCAPKNIRSQKIPETLSFRREGCIRDGEWLYDHYVDLIVYAILQNEWKNSDPSF